MQAITAKYIGPTNFKGSRIKARCAAGSITLDYDDALNFNENALKACRVLINKLQWDLPLFKICQGTIYDGQEVFIIQEVEFV